MDPSKAPTGKSWSAIASQAPSSSSRGTTTLRPGARLTLRSSRSRTPPRATPGLGPTPRFTALRGRLANNRIGMHSPTITPAERHQGLSWPEKMPQKLTYDWDHAYMASGQATYAREVRQFHRKGQSHMAGNGLINALNTSYDEENRAKYQEQGLGDTNNERRKNSLHGATKAVAFEESYGTRPYELNTKKHPDTAAFNTGKPIPGVSSGENSSRYANKQIIPCKHDHSKCQNWLVDEFQGFDDLYQRTLRSGIINLDLIVSAAYLRHEQNTKGMQRASGFGNNSAADMSGNGQLDPFLERFRPKEVGVMLDKFNSDLGPNGYDRVDYPEKGWTSSRVWVSGEEKERIRYEKIKDRRLRNGTEDSPCFPRSPGRLMKHRAEVAAAKKRAKEKEIRDLEQDLERLGRVARYGPLEQLEVPVAMSPRLAWISESDGMTLVGGRPTLWTDWHRKTNQVDWPTLQELEAYGDECAKEGGCRFFPLPRLQVLDPQYYQGLASSTNPMPKTGPGVPRECRIIDANAIVSMRYDGLSHFEALLLEQPTREMYFGDLPWATRELIESIEEDDAYF